MSEGPKLPLTRKLFNCPVFSGDVRDVDVLGGVLLILGHIIFVKFETSL